MKMVRHKAPGVDTPAGLGAGFAESFEKDFAVLVILKDGFATVAAVHDVIDGTRILDAQFSGHAAI